MGPTADVRAAIDDVNSRVAWALDHHEYEDLADLFAPEMHYVGVGGEFTSVDDLIASFRARPGTRTTRHGLSTMRLDVHDEGTVEGRSCWHTFATNEADSTAVDLYMVADFHDVYVQCDDSQWRIAERIITPVFRDPRLAPSHAASTKPSPAQQAAR